MKSDIPIKRILQVRPQDWIAFLYPEYIGANLVPLNSVIVPKAESRIDNIQFVDGKFIFQLEPNGYLDNAMPARMLRYKADIWEYTLSKKMGTPEIKQVLLLFFKKHDNQIHNLTDSHIDYNYEVVKVWELHKSEIMEKRLIALYPLIPLMKTDIDETPDSVITDTIQIIDDVSNESLKIDLMVAMTVLATEKYSKELVKKYVRREFVMQSELLQEWVEELAEERSEIKAEKISEEKSFQRALQIAKKLLMRGLPQEDISEDTGLTLREIQSLKEGLSN